MQKKENKNKMDQYEDLSSREQGRVSERTCCCCCWASRAELWRRWWSPTTETSLPTTAEAEAEDAAPLSLSVLANLSVLTAEMAVVASLVEVANCVVELLLT